MFFKLVFPPTLHLTYPYRLAPCSTTPMITTGIHLILNENRVLKTKMVQRTGHTISPSQKILDSESDACCFSVPFLDSNTQWLRPSSSTWFHHRRPTISLPVMFFTVQKSHESRRIIVTMQAMKLPLTISESRYTTMALTLKKRWKKAATGCLTPDFFDLFPASSSASNSDTSSSLVSHSC